MGGLEAEALAGARREVDAGVVAAESSVYRLPLPRAETVDAEARLEQRERRRRVEHARARDGRVGREETVKALFFGVFYGFP